MALQTVINNQIKKIVGIITLSRFQNTLENENKINPKKIKMLNIMSILGDLF
jgi:hypothetical protein